MNKTHDLGIFVQHDATTGEWWVEDTELPGMSLGDTEPGRLLPRIQISALDLLELNAESNAGALGTIRAIGCGLSRSF